VTEVELPEISTAKKKLFVVFSRFGFALKEHGFVAGRSGEDAKPDWDRFSEESVLKGFVEEIRQDTEVRELLDNPPMKQIVVCHNDGSKSCDWKAPTNRPDELMAQLLLAVRRVRNNFFHGGKHGEDARDERLCRAALRILSECLKRHDGVRNLFEGKY
jgi:hypothetical protein